LKDEVEMGHIRLSREADLVVVAPASANLIAKLATGRADDLASTALLASNKPLLLAPAMNTQMWNHPATQRNLAQVKADGGTIITPGEGTLACGETGAGRMAEPDDILQAILKHLRHGKLEGVKALVTSGPTYEAIDPVRFIGNHSSGKQGHAIAAALARHGADVTLVSGPTGLPDPKGVNTLHVTSAEEMLKACEQSLPADIAVCAAAVADWKVSAAAARKLKKAAGGAAPELLLIENPDILAHIAQHPSKRPSLVVGFAAETENVLQNAAEKRIRKHCDWILANDVSEGKAFNQHENTVTLITAGHQTTWPLQSKEAIAEALAQEIIQHRSHS
ncbi:MAG: bifunctional phosphopantothenoylcysteine decarboxylase/phosphopantothenate--cysteine ligase CoaBC, partial [Rickettsiales bacterium]|nr:bifunctional phosphopantothenoylcysteine decarboxylase/phosphopantothenate--cysteine ligase CoaBC [Rickettsiales bacterium]